MPDRVVIDTNIWISCIITGKLGDLEMMASTHGIEYVVCKDMIDEIEGVISRQKFAKRLVYTPSDYIDSIKRVTTPVKIIHKFTGCRDPKDNFLFDLAKQSKAKYLVSGDLDVLETAVKRPPEVLTLTEFIRKLHSELN